MWIITDGAVKTPGIGTTLYLTRNNKLQLAGFFSAKLRGRQFTWLPCEIEILFKAAATKHFSPYIIQSKTPPCILTDSKPCVQSFEKLCRGEFSSSPCVATFLSTVSRYQASVRRVAGAAILPSDFASRNALECDNPTCQVCSFVQSTKDSTVLRSSVQSILSGTASAKLRGRQFTWLPCEIEILFKAAATKHFSPYIIQSKTPPCILTDSKPCVQSFEKLCRGEFSSSPCVATFLSTVSRYQASVRRVAGAAILPSDFASRNALECDNPTCQVCSFVQSTKDSTVLRSSVQSILSGTAKLPFTSRAAWVAPQAECSDLRRTYAHLTQATRPSKKLTNIKDVTLMWPQSLPMAYS